MDMCPFYRPFFWELVGLRDLEIRKGLYTGPPKGALIDPLWP